MQRMIEVPSRVPPTSDNGYFEELTKAIFRSGFSWWIVRQKWDNFQKAFDEFEVSKVANYEIKDITRLFCDCDIIRNRRKILGTVDNSRTILDLVKEHGSFRNYLRSMDHLDYNQRVRELTGKFRWLGRTGAFVFLYCVDEPTPKWPDR